MLQSRIQYIFAIIGLCSIYAFSAKAEVVEFGEMTSGGNACFQRPVLSSSLVQINDDTISGDLISIPRIEESLMIIPNSILVKKLASESGIKRGTCQFALPISVDQNHRLVIRTISQSGHLNLGANSEAMIQSEIFKAGEKGQVLKLSEKTVERRVSKSIEMINEEQLLVSECGEKFILRGNTSIILKGQSNRSTARTDELAMAISVEECQ